VAVFSFHPGLLDIGLTGDHLRRSYSGDLEEDRVKDWLHKQRDAGAFNRNEDAGRMLMRLADGTADALSGGYFTVDTDLPHSSGTGRSACSPVEISDGSR
jgi:5-hydroxydodecatetraenal polyketide synthase CpkA